MTKTQGEVGMTKAQELLGVIGEGNEVKQVADILRSSKSKLMDMRKDFEKIFSKKDIDFVFSPVAHFRIKVGSKTLVVVNKKYADEAEEIVGEYAIGFEGKI